MVRSLTLDQLTPSPQIHQIHMEGFDEVMMRAPILDVLTILTLFILMLFLTLAHVFTSLNTELYLEKYKFILSC